MLLGSVVSFVFSAQLMASPATPDLFELIPGTLRAGAASFKGSAGVRCHPDGRIYVADNLAHRVLVFTASGDFLQAFGGQGTALGRLLFADAVHWDADGRLYVADTGANRIQVWEADGRAIGAFGHAASPLLARARRTTGLLALACVGGAVLVGGAHALGWGRPRALVAIGAAACVAGGASAGLALAAPRVLDLPRDVWIARDGRCTWPTTAAMPSECSIARAHSSGRSAEAAQPATGCAARSAWRPRPTGRLTSPIPAVTACRSSPPTVPT